jgi:wyosine [tRNA(Phe)-imidazoG37] synthetase (radical SAM superfamily)
MAAHDSWGTPLNNSCKYDCVYCESSFKRQMKRRKKSALTATISRSTFIRACLEKHGQYVKQMLFHKR